MCNHELKDLIGTKDGIMCRVCGKIIDPADIGKPAKVEAKDEPLPFTGDEEVEELAQEEPTKKPAKRGRKAAK